MEEVTGSAAEAAQLLNGIGVDVSVDKKEGKPGTPAHYRAEISQDGEILSSGKGRTPRHALIRALLVGLGVPEEEAAKRTSSLPGEDVMVSGAETKAILDAEGLRIILLAGAVAISADATIDNVSDMVDEDDDDDFDDDGDGEEEG